MFAKRGVQGRECREEIPQRGVHREKEYLLY
jgi:hypothetical protein